MTQQAEQRLTVSQAARAAGVAESTVRLWIRTGRLDAEQTPLGALVHLRALGECLAARRAAGARIETAVIR